MRDVGIVQGSSKWAVPVVIGTDTVYEHKDIVKIDVDAQGNPVDDLYQYHEIQYTHEEWMKELGDRNQSLESNLAEAQKQVQICDRTIDEIMTEIIPSLMMEFLPSEDDEEDAEGGEL